MVSYTRITQPPASQSDFHFYSLTFKPAVQGQSQMVCSLDTKLQTKFNKVRKTNNTENIIHVVENHKLKKKTIKFQLY